MSGVMVTGMSGTGKSSALPELGRRGYRVVDTDDPGWREYRGDVESVDQLHRGEWLWVPPRPVPAPRNRPSQSDLHGVRVYRHRAAGHHIWGFGAERGRVVERPPST